MSSDTRKCINLKVYLYVFSASLTKGNNFYYTLLAFQDN